MHFVSNICLYIRRRLQAVALEAAALAVPVEGVGKGGCFSFPRIFSRGAVRGRCRRGMTLNFETSRLELSGQRYGGI